MRLCDFETLRLIGDELVLDLQLTQSMILLLHTANSAHVHPDQFAVALVISAFIVGGSWVMQRRRS